MRFQNTGGHNHASNKTHLFQYSILERIDVRNRLLVKLAKDRFYRPTDVFQNRVYWDCQASFACDSREVRRSR